jgi:two-component system response regulator ChvI
MHMERLQTDRAMICGKLLLRPNATRAYWDAENVNLTFDEYDAILLLASSVPQCVSYEAICDCFRFGRLAAASEGQSRRKNVRAAIARIRRKFRKIDATFDKIGIILVPGTIGKRRPEMPGSLDRQRGVCRLH